MLNLYGSYPEKQINKYKELLRKKIFFLLLYVADDSKDRFQDVDVNQAFENILLELGGYNEIFGYLPEIIRIMSMLSSARQELSSDEFDFYKYRRLVLGAGSEILKVKEV